MVNSMLGNECYLVLCGEVVGYGADICFSSALIALGALAPPGLSRISLPPVDRRMGMRPVCGGRHKGQL